MTTIFTVVGIAGVAHLSSYLLEETGNGKYAMFVNIGAYCACVYIVLDRWWSAVHYVVAQFGVMI